MATGIISPPPQGAVLPRLPLAHPAGPPAPERHSGPFGELIANTLLPEARSA